MNNLRKLFFLIFMVIVVALAAHAIEPAKAQTPTGPCLTVPQDALLTEWNEIKLWMAVGRPGEISVIRYDNNTQTTITPLTGIPISLTWDYQPGLDTLLYYSLNDGSSFQWNIETGLISQISQAGFDTGTPDSETHDGEGGNIGAGGLDADETPPISTPTPTCVPEKKVSMAYTNEKKAIAIAIVGRHGGKVSAPALEEIRVVIGEPNLPAKTVRRWLQDVNQAPKGQNVPEMSPLKKPQMTPAMTAAVARADGALDKVFEEITRVYAQKVLLAALTEEIKAKDAMTIAAIAYDKQRLAAGLPTEIIRVLPILIQKIEQSGMNPHDIFNDMIAELDAEQRAIVKDDSSR